MANIDYTKLPLEVLSAPYPLSLLVSCCHTEYLTTVRLPYLATYTQMSGNNDICDFKIHKCTILSTHSLHLISPYLKQPPFSLHLPLPPQPYSGQDPTKFGTFQRYRHHHVIFLFYLHFSTLISFKFGSKPQGMFFLLSFIIPHHNSLFWVLYWCKNTKN